MIDSHAHLEMTDFDRDRPQTLMRARRAGVEAIVTVGTTLADCRKAVAIAEGRNTRRSMPPWASTPMTPGTSFRRPTTP